MITDIPSDSDFKELGIALLNLAWESFVGLQARFAEAHLEEWDGASEVYWESAQRPLAAAITLVQQGLEFLLKARIVRTSPFLLIASDPGQWPRRCDKEDTPFSSFKTVDAQDLIRVHDTVIAPRLGEEFVAHYQTLRRLRNTLVHTVDKQVLLTAKDLLTAILETSHHMIGPRNWLPIRRQYIESVPVAYILTDHYVENDLLFEFPLVIDLLEPSETERFLGFDKRQRCYICPACAKKNEHFESLPKLAQLHPNEPESTEVYCILCDIHSKVIRDPCRFADCMGNVIDEQDRLCLTCYREQGRQSSDTQ
jgi:hypothetical protein